MDDTISRESVKELAHKQVREKYCGMAFKKHRDFYIKLADNIIDLLPSAQPYTIHSDGRLWVTVDDIDKVRAVVVDEHKSKFCKQFYEDYEDAQPEIIYCGDCKYKDDGIDEDGIPFLKCLHGRSYGGTRINDFCSWAERR